MTTFFSHPGIPLDAHLAGVAGRMRSLVQSMFMEGTIVDKALFSDVAFVTGLLHDLGKYTTFFQRHLADSSYGPPESHHACLSALAAAEAVRLLAERRSTDRQARGMLPVVAYMAVRRHHGNLLSASYELNDEEIAHFTEWGTIRPQAGNIIVNAAAVADLTRVLREHLGGSEGTGVAASDGVPGAVIDLIGRLARGEETPAGLIARLRPAFLAHARAVAAPSGRPGPDPGPCWYFSTQLMFSLLVDSDKKFAAGVGAIPRGHIPPDIVDRYKRDVFGAPEPGSVDELRSSFYGEVRGFPATPRAPGDRPILSITAPTGIGKTLAVLAFALGLRSSISEGMGYAPRIVYCLPFTSIIDQNHDVIAGVLARYLPDYAGNEEQYLLKHHHLSKGAYHVDGDELPNEHALALVDSWESEIITTTFVQLFDTMLGCDNKALKKFHALAGAIVVLDEVQSFPPEYWALLRCCFTHLARRFNTRVVMVTATRPAIFDDGEVREVLADPSVYFGSPLLDRVTLHARLSPVTLRTLASELVGGDLTTAGSTLAVVNTIAASIELHDLLLAGLPGAVPLAAIDPRAPGWVERAGTRPVLVYLSTNITPVERRDRIRAVKALGKAGKRFVAVTTQMVEAGVDLDAGMAVRDHGPLDSIIQVSGRCNRNGKLTKGKVTVVRLVKPDNRQYAADVYSPQLLRFSEEALAGAGAITGIPESTFPRIARGYFAQVRSEARHAEGYRRIIERLDYHVPGKAGGRKKRPETVSDFCLIDDDQQKTDVFVDNCAASAAARHDVQDAITGMARATTRPAYFNAKARLGLAMKALRKHVVQVPSRACADLPRLFALDDMRVLDGATAGARYDPHTGFARDP